MSLYSYAPRAATFSHIQIAARTYTFPMDAARFETVLRGAVPQTGKAAPEVST